MVSSRCEYESSILESIQSNVSQTHLFLILSRVLLTLCFVGGAKVTQILIVWCTVATICLGVVIHKTAQLEKPENNFGLFVFLFLNVFFCLGAMNGTTFRTIGVLFDYKLAGPALGWSSAIASYGAFVIPAMFAVAISAGKPEATLYGMACYYFFCGCLNFYYYTRPGAERPGV